jgi:hypothetical protein
VARRSFLAATLLAAAVHATAAGPAVKRLPEGTVVRLERLLDDPAWHDAPVFDAFVERLPVNGAVPSERTTLRVLAGPRALYVGVRAGDHEPAGIRAPLGPHDSVRGSTQDCVVVLLDPVGSRKAAPLFVVNARGITADGVYTADTNSEDLAPDHEFEAAARIDAQGWSAVLRIPYSALRYAAGGQGEWRLLVRRIRPRDSAQEFSSAPLPPQAPDLLATLPALQGMGSPPDPRFLKLLPSTSWVHTRQRATDGLVQSEHEAHASLDLKWRPVEDLVLDATLRPDFSQVDLDVPQLRGNTRFALYFDEKRPFFQESADLWQTPTSQLYTRAVTRPDWGLRATRRNEAFAGTAFLAHDAGGGELLLPNPWGTGAVPQPASRALATRLRWDGDEGHASLVALQRRYGGSAGENTLLGTDFALPLPGPGVRLRGQVMGSHTTARPGADGVVLQAGPARGGHHVWLKLEQRAEAVETMLLLEEVDSGYRNDLGFVTQAGVRHVEGDVSVVWRNLGPLAELWAYLFAIGTRSIDDAVGVHHGLRPGIYLVHENGLHLTVELRAAERLRTAPQRDAHAERYLHLELEAQPAAWLPSLRATLAAGRLVDMLADQAGPSHRASVDGELRLSERSGLTLSLQQQADRAGRYAEHAAQAKLSHVLAPGLDLRLIGTQQRAHRSAPADAAGEYRERSLSLSLRKVWSRYRALYLGVSRAHSVGPPGEASGRTEVYLKYMHAVELQ